VRERCGSEVAGARALSIATAAQQLYAVELGDGPRGVVLIHGSGSRGLCNWSAELEWMQDAGLHVLAYDQTCVGESTCAAPQEPEGDLRAAVSELKRRGAVAVIAIAASAGGPQAIDVASDPTSGVAAAVALSPVGPASSDTPRIPLLIAADPADTFVDLRSLRSVREAAPDLVNLEVVRGTGHAQQLLYDAARPTRGSALRKVMLAFVARHGGGR
jgi:hypothetical protein